MRVELNVFKFEGVLIMGSVTGLTCEKFLRV